VSLSLLIKVNDIYCDTNKAINWTIWD
jgi:hypothetical protein